MHEFVNDRRQKFAAALRRRFVQHLHHQLAILSREPLHHTLEAVTRSEDPDQLEEIANRAERKTTQLLRRSRLLLQTLDHFSRIKNQREEFLKLLRRHPLAEHLLHKRTKRT